MTSVSGFRGDPIGPIGGEEPLAAPKPPEARSIGENDSHHTVLNEILNKHGSDTTTIRCVARKNPDAENSDSTISYNLVDYRNPHHGKCLALEIQYEFVNQQGEVLETCPSMLYTTISSDEVQAKGSDAMKMCLALGGNICSAADPKDPLHKVMKKAADNFNSGWEISVRKDNKNRAAVKIEGKTVKVEIEKTATTSHESFIGRTRKRFRPEDIKPHTVYYEGKRITGVVIAPPPEPLKPDESEEVERSGEAASAPDDFSSLLNGNVSPLVSTES